MFVNNYLLYYFWLLYLISKIINIVFNLLNNFEKLKNMNNLDYFTIMEPRINHFAQKYDPQNRLGRSFIKAVTGIAEERTKKSVRKKVLAGLKSAVAFFL